MLVLLVVLAPAVGDPVADAPTTQAATWLSPGLLTRPPSGADVCKTGPEGRSSFVVVRTIVRI